MSLKQNGKIIKSINIGKKKVTLLFLDDSKLEISPNTYSEFNLYKNKELSDENLAKINERNSLDKYYTYALKTVSKYFVSEKQLRDKLVNKGANKEQIKFIIKELKKCSLLSDDKLIDNYIEYANGKNYGENKIRNELYKKGISLDKINDIYFDPNVEIDKASNELAFLEKKYSNLSYLNKKTHIYNALAMCGFSLPIINFVAKKIKENDKKIELENLKKEYIKAYNKYSRKYKSKELETKVINYLLSKGYLYVDILKIKETM